MMGQRNGVKDSFDNPQLFDRGQINGCRLPPAALETVTGLEAGLAVKAVRAVDHPLPPAAALQLKAHGCAGLAGAMLDIAFLRVPAADQRQVEATVVVQV